MDKNPRFDISVLLPTHKRTDALSRSIGSLVENSSGTTNIEFLFGIDENDDIGKNHFFNVVRPYLEGKGLHYTALEFDPLGYERLNEYFNGLAKQSQGRWLFVWGDDAIMETQDWDKKITEYDGKFLLLRVITHMSHPYSIFPIFPKEWRDLFDYCSWHQMIDAELSQHAYFLDIMQDIDVVVTHDRHDLTGNNQDETMAKRRYLEGNPSDPRDFHHPGQLEHRRKDLLRLAEYLKLRGNDMTFWKNVLAGKQDPWEKLKQKDINNLTYTSDFIKRS